MIDWFVFVDESGDLGALGTKYFVVVAIQIKDEKLLGRVVKRARQRKLKKKLAEVPELKGYNSSPELRQFILRRIASLDCGIYVLAVEKKQVFPSLMAAQNKLYNWLCRVLCQQISGKEIKLVVDKKYNNRLLRSDFNKYIIRELLSYGIKTTVEHTESHACPALQAVDFVAWAANRKYSGGDDSYYKIIEPKVLNKGKEELWR